MTNRGPSGNLHRISSDIKLLQKKENTHEFDFIDFDPLGGLLVHSV